MNSSKLTPERRLELWDTLVDGMKVSGRKGLKACPSLDIPEAFIISFTATFTSCTLGMDGDPVDRMKSASDLADKVKAVITEHFKDKPWENNQQENQNQ